jgi:hypothetical protein
VSEIGLMPPGRLGHVDETSCFVCGCTDQVACPGGCWWAADDEEHGQDVCSRCVELRDDLIAAGRPLTLEQLSERSGEERDQAKGWIRLRELEDGGSLPAPEWLDGLGS